MFVRAFEIETVPRVVAVVGFVAFCWVQLMSFGSRSCEADISEIVVAFSVSVMAVDLLCVHRMSSAHSGLIRGQQFLDVLDEHVYFDVSGGLLHWLGLAWWGWGVGDDGATPERVTPSGAAMVGLMPSMAIGAFEAR